MMYMYINSATGVDLISSVYYKIQTTSLLPHSNTVGLSIEGGKASTR